MKKFLIFSMLIPFGMICSCQKQDSAAEQQPAQPKAELDAREQSLDERVNALDERVSALNERVNALAEKEKATTKARTILPDVQGQVLAPAQVEPERHSTIQQLPADALALIADPSQVDSERAEKNRRTQEQLAQSQRPEEVQRRSQRKFEQSQKWSTSGAAVSPAANATSPTPLPAVEATSPTPP
jgi:outer membrane translocation and assembly module TamA